MFITDRDQSTKVPSRLFIFLHLYTHKYTHTHINNHKKCRDQRTIRSSSSPLSRNKRDLKFPRTSPSAFYSLLYIKTWEEEKNFSFEKKTRRSLHLSRNHLSLSLIVSRKNGFDRLVKHAPIFSRDTDRFSFFFYAQTACRKP